MKSYRVRLNEIHYLTWEGELPEDVVASGTDAICDYLYAQADKEGLELVDQCRDGGFDIEVTGAWLDDEEARTKRKAG